MRISGDLANILLLAFVAALYPTLLAAVATLLLLPTPKRLMLGYLLGAYTTSITLGMVVVFALGGSTSATDAGERTLAPSLDFAIGFLFLLGAWALAGDRDARLRERRRQRQQAKQADRPETESFAERLLGRGSPRITFLAGLILSFPGVTYLLALRHISDLDTSNAAMAAVVVAFCLIQLTLLELPLLAYALVPERTEAGVASFRAWLARRGRRIVIVGMAVVGSLLLVRGVLSLL